MRCTPTMNDPSENILDSTGSQIIISIYHKEDKEMCYRKARTTGDPNRVILESRDEERDFEFEKYFENNESDQIWVAYLH